MFPLLLSSSSLHHYYSHTHSICMWKVLCNHNRNNTGKRTKTHIINIKWYCIGRVLFRFFFCLGLQHCCCISNKLMKTPEKIDSHRTTILLIDSKYWIFIYEFKLQHIYDIFYRTNERKEQLVLLLLIQNIYENREKPLRVTRNALTSTLYVYNIACMIDGCCFWELKLRQELMFLLLHIEKTCIYIYTANQHETPSLQQHSITAKYQKLL